MFGKTLVGRLLLVLVLVAAAGSVFLAAPAGDTRLSIAAMQGDTTGVRTLLQQKADVNAAQGDGTTALHWAAYKDDLEMAQLLIKAGADVKAVTRVGAMTPLCMAAKNGSAAIIDVIMKGGAYANVANTTTGTTPLM